MTYTVGQIIYLLSERSLKIVPAQIIEEVVRNTLKGKQTSYTILMPNKDRTTVDLNDINAKIFVDTVILKGFMVENAKKSINGMIDEALRIQKVFGEVPVDKNEDILEVLAAKPEEKAIPKSKKTTRKRVQNKSKKDKIKIDLGNGLKANVSIEDLTHLGVPT